MQTVYGVRDTRDYEVPEAKLQDPLHFALRWNEILSAPESSRVRLGGQEVYQIRVPPNPACASRCAARS